MHKINRPALLVLLFLTLFLSASAAPRSKQALKQAALAILNQRHNSRGMGAPALPRGDLKLLEHNDAFSVYGYKTGGFAIMGNDDLVPEVIGYSDRDFATDKNANFKWYLETAEKVINAVVASGHKMTVVAPDASKYQPAVAPMVTCHWGQESPYNDLCPIGTSSGTGGWQGYGGTGRCVTGCVATAMAQVLYYHKWPASGQGEHSVRVKQASGDPITVTVDFSQSNYEWDKMLDYYNAGYTAEQGHAVAKLMLDCGVASDMEYATDGSGTYTDHARDGLVRNFGYPETLRFVERDGYSEADWMDMVFNELSNDRPIIYGGVDTFNGGHEFVICGYDAQGRVYVNWGWDGSSEGYYDIALLNPDSYAFSAYQDMIIGIESGNSTALVDTVNVEEPGTLRSLIADSVASKVTSLTVSGSINSSDMKFLRTLAGLDSVGTYSPAALRSLDLQHASIVEGGDTYLYNGNHECTTHSGEWPELAFYGARRLRKLVLPDKVTTFGTGALSGMLSLDSLLLPTALQQEYAIADNVVYSPDTTTVLAVLPHAGSTLSLHKGTKLIDAYAMAGMHGVQNLTLPESLDSIASYAFAGASGLATLRLAGKHVPVTGARVFADVSVQNITLYVRSSMKERFARSANWKDFMNVTEYGSTLRARNASRRYGEENPRFGYRIYGDYVEGKPEISCDATPTSPVGRYPIHLSLGSITSVGVDFEDGELIVTKAQANMRAVNDTIAVGEEPVLTYVVDGLKNGEDTVSLITQPTFTLLDAQGNVVTGQLEAGTYTIRLDGAEAENYDFSYYPAVLVVNSSTTGISAVSAGQTAADAAAVYTLTGVRLTTDKQSRGKLPKGVYIINGKKVVVR